MAALSDYLESGLLHHIFRGETFAKPTKITIGLTAGVPEDAKEADARTGTTIDEIPSGDGQNLSGYTRIDLGDPSTAGNAVWLYTVEDNAQGSGVIGNSTTLVWDTALYDWGWVSGVVILDSEHHSTDPVEDPGNLLMHSRLDNPRIIYTGDSVKFDMDTLQISFK